MTKEADLLEEWTRNLKENSRLGWVKELYEGNQNATTEEIKKEGVVFPSLKLGD